MSTSAVTTQRPWASFHCRRSGQSVPLKPHEDVCAFIRTRLRGFGERVLLLGSTPELADLADRTVAVDSSEESLALIWPGNGPARYAARANWLALPCAAGMFSAVIGDGSLNCLEYPHGYLRLFEEMARILRPGGRAVIRIYVRPEVGESIAHIRNEVLAGRVGHVDALKWRLAHALCSARKQSNLPVTSIYHAFEDVFPDRQLLRRLTGWSDAQLERVDAYANLPDVFSFPSARQLLALVPSAFAHGALYHTGAYELAERCPMLVMERRS